MSSMSADPKKQRMAQPAPVGYVAGLGRGAVGFTTRSDIGPARAVINAEVGAAVPMRGEVPQGRRNVVSFGQAPAGYVAGRGRGVSGFGGPTDGDAMQLGAAATAAAAAGTLKTGPKDEDAGADFSDTNFDQFSGFSENLFSSAPYEDDDREADMIYQAIDRRMESRRKARREAAEAALAEENRRKNPTIREQFADAKRELANMSAVDWESIPEAGDYSRNNKFITKQNMERFTPLPDSVIETARLSVSSQATVDPMAGVTSSASGFSSTVTDFAQLGRARDTMLSMKLDKLSDSVGGQTVVDPKGYLTEMNSIKISSEAEISDIKKARTLLKSVTNTNPTHAPGWIAAARLEETAGKLVAARSLIEKGCECCPTNEDVWLEAARLNIPANAKTILAKAVRQLPNSVKLWLRAADLETESVAKKAVLRRGLELIPTSLKLWKAAIELEELDEARVMLSRAVECVPPPDSVELWLALARLETYDNAQVVLNNARHAIPNNPTIWITAAKLEEAHGHSDKVERIIRKAVKSMEQQKVVINRDAWLKDAEAAERAGSPITCQALVRATIGMGVDEQDRKATWLADADSMLSKKSIETAKAIYAHLLTTFPNSRSLWIKAAEVEKQFGTPSSLETLLQKAVEFCPHDDVLWLMAAKEKWLQGDVPGARGILKAANAANPDSESIWLAAVKLEFENDELDRARALLSRARDRTGTEKVWMKSVVMEREWNDLVAAATLCEQALKLFPESWKLWLLSAQIATARGTEQHAKELYQQACKACPNQPAIWINTAEFEARISGIAKARSILETARLKMPQNPLIWLKSIKIENETGNKKSAQSLMAKSLQECPLSGVLWSYAIEMEPRPQRKSKSYDALKKCHDDPFVFVTVAKLLWADRNIEKARDWFNRAVTVNPDLGDAWAHFYKFELQHGNPETQKACVSRCQAADPRHGELWTKVSKAVGNIRLKTVDILPKVAELVNLPL